MWPPAHDPRRAPYRGWEPLEDIDAGVFFGRDAAIVQGLDELRDALFVVLGPSGIAKAPVVQRKRDTLRRCRLEVRILSGALWSSFQVNAHRLSPGECGCESHRSPQP